MTHHNYQSLRDEPTMHSHVDVHRDVTDLQIIPLATFPSQVVVAAQQQGEHNSDSIPVDAFHINKLKFLWRDPSLYRDVHGRNYLQTVLISKRQYICDDMNLNAPTLIAQKYHEDAATTESDPSREVMAVCLPCFNEEWSEMSGTLRGLAENIRVTRHCRKQGGKNNTKLEVLVFIIQDGWDRASASLKEGTQKEFGCPPADWFTRELTRSAEGAVVVAPRGELFYPAAGTKCGASSGGATFFPVFVTKSRNAQKFNSHLLFFAMCNMLKPTSVFLTDCGTSFYPNCLSMLMNYLQEKRHEVAGVTARQRIMNPREMDEVQRYPYWWDPSSSDCIGSSMLLKERVKWWLSPAPLQGFECEATCLLNTAMFTTVGSLPCLPGPCQLIQWRHLAEGPAIASNDESALDMYFRQLTMDLATAGVVKSSLLLAEDRILSFSVAFRNAGYKTEYVRGATFLYEPMMSWVQLLGQRRRWINGTNGAFFYYVGHKEGLHEFQRSSLRESWILPFLWRLQLYQSFMQLLSPSFLCISLYEAVIQQVQDSMDLDDLPLFSAEATWQWPLYYFCFYLLWVMISMCLGKKPPSWTSDFYTPCMDTIYNFFSLVNAGICGFIFYSMVGGILEGHGALYAQIIMITLWILPLLISLLFSMTSAALYLLYLPMSLIQMAQYVTFMPAYAFARMHDLSWGNRPSTVSRTETEDALWSFTWKANVVSIMANAGILSGYVILESHIGHSAAVVATIAAVITIPMVVQICFACVYMTQAMLRWYQPGSIVASPKSAAAAAVDKSTEESPEPASITAPASKAVHTEKRVITPRVTPSQVSPSPSNDDLLQSKIHGCDSYFKIQDLVGVGA